MEALTLFLQGAALGMTAAFTPGIFQSFLINQSLAGGWRRGAPVAFSPLISDPAIIIAILLLLGRLPEHFLRWIGLFGGLFALYLAWIAWREWRAGSKTADVSNPTAGNPLFKGALMNLLSPGPYLFWSLVCGPILLAALRQSVLQGLSFLAGFYLLFIGGMLVLVALFHQARRLGPAVVHGLTLVSILVLLAFGLVLIWQASSSMIS